MASAAERIRAARAAFPGTRGCTYIDLGGRGLLSEASRAAVEAHLDDMMYGRIDKDRLFAATEETRALFARLINADADEVAYTKNISEGLNLIASAIDWQPGDNVVVCPELEHPNNIYLWLNLRRYGVEVRCVHHRDGRMPVGAMIDAMDRRTRVLTASSVSFSPGFRTDIDRLGRACRERGVLFLVDAAQSGGVLHHDVVASSVDALAVSTQKGLLGLYGMGFLYVRKAVAETLTPRHLARFGVDLGTAEAHESDLGDFRFEFMPAARRFDLGNYNFAAIAAVNASLQLLLDIGTRAVEAHVLELADALATGLHDLGFPVCAGLDPAERAGIVTVGRYGSGNDKASSDDCMNRLCAHLRRNGVVLSMRRGVLRFSFHLYNDSSDVERVLDLARQPDARGSLVRA